MVAASVLALAAVSASAAAAQTPCNAGNLVGMWKLISETPVVDPPVTPPSAEYLEVRSGLLFWVTQPAEGERTRTRHRAYFAGSTVDVRPALDKAPQIVRCTRSGSRLTLLTSDLDGGRRGRLEFRKTGR